MSIKNLAFIWTSLKLELTIHHLSVFGYRAAIWNSTEAATFVNSSPRSFVDPSQWSNFTYLGKKSQTSQTLEQACRVRKQRPHGMRVFNTLHFKVRGGGRRTYTDDSVIHPKLIPVLYFPFLIVNGKLQKAGLAKWLEIAVASHQCDPGTIPRVNVICGLSLLVLFSSLLCEVFVRLLWFSTLYKKATCDLICMRYDMYP